MAAPIQGAQVAQQAQQTNQKELSLQKVQESKFDAVMAQKANMAQASQQVQQASQVQKAQQVSQAQKVTETQKAEKAKLDKTNVVTDKAVAPTEKSGSTMLQKVVGDLEHGQNTMDKLINSVVSGNNKMNYQQLTVLQMQVYQYSQEMELTSKVVSKATDGLKDTLKTQV
jgi:hypothetical protein